MSESNPPEHLQSFDGAPAGEWRNERGGVIDGSVLRKNIGRQLSINIDPLLAAGASWGDIVASLIKSVHDQPERALLESFPFLAGCDLPMLTTYELLPEFEQLTTRSERILMRVCMSRDLKRRWSSLSSFRLLDLMATTNAGPRTIDDIIRVVVEIAARWDGFQKADVAPVASTGSSVNYAQEVSDMGLLFDNGLRDLLAAWLDLKGTPTTLQSLMNAWGANEIPREIRDSVADIANFDLKVDGEGIAIFERIETLLNSLEPRMLLIIEKRTIAIRQETLQVLADELDLTRERVRQIESEASDALKQHLDLPEFWPVSWAASEFRSELGSCFDVNDQAVGDFIERLLGIGFSERNLNLLMHLSGPYSPSGGLMTCLDLRMIRSELDERSGPGHLGPVDVNTYLAAHGIEERFIDSAMATIGGYRKIDGEWFPWQGTLVDKAEIVLAISGEPMTVEAIAEEFIEEVSARSLRIRILEDERFKRVNRTHVGLAGWETEEYVSIAQSIAGVIAERGGSCELAVIMDELARRFSIRPSSAEAYARAPMFVVAGGQVRLRRANEAFVARESVARSRGCFRFMDTAIAVVAIDQDGNRGSGRQISPGFSATLDVRPGDDRIFQGDGFAVRVLWPITSPNGGSFGSIRDAIVAAGGANDELLRLTFDIEDETVSAAIIDPSFVSANSRSQANVESWLGIVFDSVEDLYRQFSLMLECEPRDVVERLIRRGDSDLAALFPDRQTRKLDGGWEIEG